MLRVILIWLVLSTSPAHASIKQSCESLLTNSRSAIVQIWNLIFGKRKFVVPALDREQESRPTVAIESPQKGPDIGTSAPPGDEYIARNKGMDRPSPEESAEIQFRFNRPQLVYFTFQKYVNIDAENSKFSVDRSSAPGLLPKLKRLDSGDELTIHVDNLKSNEGFVAIPFGYEAISYAGDGAEISSRPHGVYFRRVGHGDVHVQLRPIAPKELSPNEILALTQVSNPPSITEYPEPWQLKLNSLLSRRKVEKLSDLQVAQELKEFIQTSLQYEVDDSPERGVLEFCTKGSVQCDGASLIFVAILRSIFKIPSLAIGGVKSVQNVSDSRSSVILDQATPHMFSAVYDPAARLFVVMDPTPSNQTREKNNPEKSDQRFNNWPEDGSGNERPEIQARVEEMWSRLFAEDKSQKWQEILSEIDNELTANRNQFGLPPELDSMYQNVRYLTQISPFVTRESLRGMTQSAAFKKSEDRDLKMDYLRLQILARIGQYGIRYAGRERSQLYRRITDLAVNCLNSIPKSARRLSETYDLIQQLPHSLAKDAAESLPSKRSVLWQLARLAKRVELALIRNFTLQPSVAYERSFTPTDDDEVDLVLAEGFEHMEHFERQGLPRKYDAVRVFGDDMQVRQWREPTLREPLQPTFQDGGEVTFILFDLSSSNENDNKGLIRDRLIALWLDELKGQKIVLIGYRKSPEKEFTIDNAAAAKSRFNEMLVEGEYYQSKGGNALPPAFSKAIAVAKEFGSRYQKVNFRLITDGEESFDIAHLRAAKDSLGPDVELNMTAVTLWDGNEVLREFITQSATANLLGQGVFIHLTREDFEDVLRPRDERRETKLNSFLPENFREIGRLPSYMWEDMKRTGQRL